MKSFRIAFAMYLFTITTRASSSVSYIPNKEEQQRPYKRTCLQQRVDTFCAQTRGNFLLAVATWRFIG